jgi:hypothetical protein
MRRKFAFITLPITLFAVALLSAQSIPLAGTNTAQEQKKQPKSGDTKKNASLTGCVDEQDGHYVLVDERTLTPIANLEADGFPLETFAKHLGHKVTVRGISSSGIGRPIFKVRSIDTISDACASQNY